MANSVLILDDDVNARIIAGTLLDIRGIRARGTGDRDEARAILNDEPPAVVLLDLGFATRNGFEFLRNFWRITDPLAVARAPRLVMMTDQREPEVEQFATRLGADRFLRKPFEPGQFLDLIESLLTPTSHGAAGNGGWDAEAS